MSLSLWLCGADIRSCQVHEVGCSTAPVMSRRQFSLAIFGVWPRSRIGQVLTSCWPGGSRLSAGRDVMPVRNLPSCAHLDLVWVSLLSSGVSAMGTSVHWPEHGRGGPKVNGYRGTEARPALVLLVERISTRDPGVMHVRVREGVAFGVEELGGTDTLVAIAAQHLVGHRAGEGQTAAFLHRLPQRAIGELVALADDTTHRVRIFRVVDAVHDHRADREHALGRRAGGRGGRGARRAGAGRRGGAGGGGGA